MIPVPTTLLVSPASISIRQGDETGIIAKVVDQNGFLMTGATVSFTVGDTAIVRVNAAGSVFGDHAGATQVTVSYQSLSRTIPAAVAQVMAGAAFDEPTLQLRQLDPVQLHARAIDLAGDEVSGAAITYRITDTTVPFTVSPSGMLRSLGRVGGGQVVAEARKGDRITGGVVQVDVVPVAAALEVVPSSVVIDSGSSQALAVTVRDLVGDSIPGLAVTYEVQDPAALRATSAGVLFSVGALGVTTVDVRANGVHQVVPVTVVPYQRSAWNVVASLPARFPTAVAAHANGTFAAADRVGTATLGSWKTLSIDRTLASAPGGRAVVFDLPGDQVIVGADGFPGVSALDVRTGAVVWTALSTLNVAEGLVVSPDGATIYVGVGGGVIVALDAATRTEQWRANIANQDPSYLVLHPTRPVLYASGGSGGVVSELDLITRAERQLFPAAAANGIAVSPDGSELYVVRLDVNALSVVSLDSYDEVRRVPFDCLPSDLVGRPDGSELIVSCNGPGRLLLLDGRGTRVTREVPLAGRPGRLAFAPDGRTVLVTNVDGWIDILR